jgi:hypothetical protein
VAAYFLYGISICSGIGGDIVFGSLKCRISEPERALVTLDGFYTTG